MDNRWVVVAWQWGIKGIYCYRSWWGRMKAAPDGGPSEEDTSELRPGKPEVGAAWGGVGRLMLRLEGVIRRDRGKNSSRRRDESPAGGALGPPCSVQVMGFPFSIANLVGSPGSTFLSGEFRSHFSRILCLNGAERWSRRVTYGPDPPNLFPFPLDRAHLRLHQG